MKVLRALGWSAVMALTSPVWAILAALEIVARLVRSVSRACVWVVEPVSVRFVGAVQATYKPVHEPIRDPKAQALLDKARKARRS